MIYKPRCLPASKRLRASAQRLALSCVALTIPLIMASASAFAADSQVFLDSEVFETSSTAGDAIWTTDALTGNVEYDNAGGATSNGAILYSSDSYRSENGFRVSVYFETSSTNSRNNNEFSFGLVRDDGSLANPGSDNPFGSNSSVVSIGANITGNQRGIRFSDGSRSTLLDTAGTRVDFAAGNVSKLTLEVARGGHWTYRINDSYEESGVVLDGLDLDESYKFAAYARSGAASKTIMAVVVENNYAPGERADNVRTTWGINVGNMVLDQITDFKTIDFAGVGFNSGASTSADHFAPNRLLEILADGESENLHVPTWGDLSQDEPQNDPQLARILAVKEANLQVQAYTNSENFAGTNGAEYAVLADRFLNWCDTDPGAVAFLDKPYMTGTWNERSQSYVDTGDFPKRKYMFCYAEYVLKDYGLRYGKYMDSWTFDCGRCIREIGGDVHDSGQIEDQRIFQAFADAIHAGDPDIPLAFNNGRSNGAAAPFSDAVFFDDFMFGHAFGGNSSHAVKGGTFERNETFIDRIEETNGSVLVGGDYDWDDKVVGNLSSKIGEGAWSYSPVKAWEDDDFLDWNLRALTSGGSMSWSGAIPRNGRPVLYDYARDLYKKLDDYLIENEAPNQPNWARGITYLPTAEGGRSYSRTLVDGEDFFDPRGRDVFISLGSDAPDWLSVNESRAGSYVLSGTPPDASAILSFDLVATESNGSSSTRKVDLIVESDDGPSVTVPGITNPITPIIDPPVNPIVDPPVVTTSSTVTITKRNAPGFAIGSTSGGANAQNVTLRTVDSNDVNQQWVEISRGDDFYSYQKAGTNFCLDGNRGFGINQNVYLWECGDNNQNQHWKKIDVGGGFYSLEKRNGSGYLLNGQSGGANGQSVTLWEALNNRNLQWQISSQ